MYTLVAKTKTKPGLACAAGSWGRLRYMYALLTPFTITEKHKYLKPNWLDQRDYGFPRRNIEGDYRRLVRLDRLYVAEKKQQLHLLECHSFNYWSTRSMMLSMGCIPQHPNRSFCCDMHYV